MTVNKLSTVVAFILALGGFSGIIGITWLAHSNEQVPDALVALTTASLGAVAGLLSPSPMQASAVGANSSSAPSSNPHNVIYVTYLVVLGVIAFVGLVGLIWLASVSANLQLDLLRATSVATSAKAPPGSSPAGTAIKGSTTAGTIIFQIPGGIVAIASAAVGAIASLFVPSPAAK